MLKHKPIDFEAKCLYNEFRINVLEKVIDQIVDTTPTIKISEDDFAKIEESTLIEIEAKYPQLKVTKTKI